MNRCSRESQKDWVDPGIFFVVLIVKTAKACDSISREDHESENKPAHVYDSVWTVDEKKFSY